MEEDSSYLLKGKAVDRHFELLDALSKFHSIFQYDKGDDRAIVILGGSFLDILLNHIIFSFFPEDDTEVETLTQPNGLLGTYGGKVRMAYCLGLIDKKIKNDLKLIGKIRNKFAHDLYASFDDQEIKSWCSELKWYKISMMMDAPGDATVRDLYQVGVNQLITYLHGAVGTARNGKRKIRDDF